MKLIYVASPYAGDVERNVEYAKQACRTVMESGHAFLAPHLMVPPQMREDMSRSCCPCLLTMSCKI